MGLYDTIEGVLQFKSGECEMLDYQIGDIIPLPDGAHVTYEGVFIVSDDKVAAAAKRVYNKWGMCCSLEEILEDSNPIVPSIRKCVREIMGEST